MPELTEWQERNGHPFSFLTEASVNLADDEELLGEMQRAGFRRVFLGIETPVEESLKEAQKSQNRGNLLESVKKIQSYGMEVMAGFIVGFDNDPEDIFERQIDFIRESAIPLAMVGLLTALARHATLATAGEGRTLARREFGKQHELRAQLCAEDGRQAVGRRLSINHAHDLQAQRILSARAGFT